jgi:hypothetical protein
MADMTSYNRISQELVDKDEYKATASGALAQSINISDAFELEEIRLHLDAAATQEDFTVTINSSDGTAYDVNLLTVSMSGTQDIVFRPIRAVPVSRKDVLDMAWTNTDAATWGLKVTVLREAGI